MRFRDILVLTTSGAFMLNGCAPIGRAARVDPVALVSATPGYASSQTQTLSSVGSRAQVGPAPKAKTASSLSDCPYVAPIDGDDALAINLDCFHFPSARAMPGADRATKKSDIAGNTETPAGGTSASSIGGTATTESNGGTDLAEEADILKASGIPKSLQASESLERRYTAYRLATVSAYYRNRLEGALLTHADMICEQEKGYIFANEASVGTIFDVLASGFSAASTIVTGDQAKSILSGLSGLSTATNSHVVANVYKNQIVPAITKAIDAERKEIMQEIIAQREKTAILYSADQMIQAVNRYHQACSFQKGLQRLLDASVNQAGKDAILKSINLRFAIQQLRRDEAEMRATLSTPPTEAQSKALADTQAKIAELVLQYAAVVQVNGGDSNTATAPEPKP